jgi:hypothetical protein
MMMVLLRTAYIPDVVSAFGRIVVTANIETSTVLNR